MSVSITFSGETLLDVAQQADKFAALAGVKAPGAKRGTKAPPEPEAEPEKPAPEVEQPETADAPPADTKALEKAKEEALDVLRKVYGRGAEGQKAVRALLKKFEVKKAGDVPVEKADALLTAAKKADDDTAEPDPI
jgi:hypothetical protein